MKRYFSTIRVDPQFSSNKISEIDLPSEMKTNTSLIVGKEVIKRDIFQDLKASGAHAKDSLLNPSTNRTKADSDELSEKETITLTINLLGDSIKDNFVLEKIMEMFPEACHLPSFDNANNRVKFQIKTEDFERNPRLQDLLRIAEKSNQEMHTDMGRDSFEYAESNGNKPPP